MSLRSIVFVVPGAPRPFATKHVRFKKMGKEVSRSRKTPGAESFENLVAMHAMVAFQKERERTGGLDLLTPPVSVEVLAISPHPKSEDRKRTPPPLRWRTKTPDGDKILRLVCDALTGVVYRDDSEVALAVVATLTAAQGHPPRTLVVVTEIGGIPEDDWNVAEILLAREASQRPPAKRRLPAVDR